jgi:tRNA pseudouridine55 synthase
MPSQEQTGFILIDKQKEWTSHDVVAYLRKVTGVKKIGHAGTLDPFATGLLIVGVGRDATKRLDEFKAMQKEYVATIKLGYVSDTYDSTGIIKKQKKQVPTGHPISGKNKKTILKDEILPVLKKFIGKQMQVPPMFSAKKVKGKKLYELARKGIEIERKANEIEIYGIELLRSTDHDLRITISCSTGTYIRSLAKDIGQALGVGAYCQELRRTKIGEYSIKNAVKPKDINIKCLTQIRI